MGKEKTKLIIIIVLIIIIIFLLLRNCEKVDNESPKPTGNVDIFNINIEGICKQDDSCKDKPDKNPVTNIDNKPSNNTNTNTNSTYPSYPTWDEDENEDDLDQVFVDDKNGNLIYQRNLNIFTNPAFEFKNMIAPGSSNTYVFEVHNNSEMNISYNIEMYEINNFNINLKYRLKVNNNYIIGNNDNWVSANELKVLGRRLTSNSSHKYSLDWKWEYDTGNDVNDTYIGEHINEDYRLNIRFRFEEDN